MSSTSLNIGTITSTMVLVVLLYNAIFMNLDAMKQSRALQELQNEIQKRSIWIDHHNEDPDSKHPSSENGNNEEHNEKQLESKSRKNDDINNRGEGSFPATAQSTIPAHLPIRNDNGLVILFLHIPKTGGMTLNNLLEPAVDHYHFGKWKMRFAEEQEKFEAALDDWQKGDTRVFEFHSSSAPAYLTQLDMLRSWRRKCLEQDIPFFAFTVLRDPESFSTSYFNYFHGGHHAKFKTFKDATEEQFMKWTIANPQCLFLAKSEMGFMPYMNRLRKALKEADCKVAYDSLKRDMDWVGTTETLSTTTIPLLEKVLGKKLDREASVNHSHKNIRWSDLSETAKQKVHDMTTWDQDMYDQAKKDFPTSKFGAFLEA